MKENEITKRLLSLALTACLLSSMTACAASEEEETEEETTTATTEATTEESVEETSEETTEETSEETTEETTEETNEETEAEIENDGNMDRQACSNEEDDARYMAFFQNEYAALADRLYIDTNYDVDIAYVDLDGNGADELLIGIESEYGDGVFCVVTEVDGTYNVAEVYGWAIQHGAMPGEYLGNGHFEGRIGNGNNYGGESQIYSVFEYDTALQNCGVVARYSESFGDNETCTAQLYTRETEDSVMYSDVFNFEPGIPGYSYESSTYNYLEDRDRPVEDAYNHIVDMYSTCDEPYSVLTWRPVTEVLG